MNSRVDTKNSTCALEFSGVVIRIGSALSQFAPGDRVVVMAPSHFGTYECVPEWACCKLIDDEDYAVGRMKLAFYGLRVYSDTACRSSQQYLSSFQQLYML